MSSERKMYPTTCADCKKETEVPFQPDPGRPVYCRECLPKHRGQRRF
ncbi:MAG: DNA-directed RNA polymerase [Marine Group I thaumarchaeote]|nr:MAG: DNA-directed RNA polymerase [Marine Group I thaumarchaeote]